MKKTILISLAGLALFLVGCAQQAPVSNQNLNQPTANINQNVNQPVVDQNQNLNQPTTNINQSDMATIKIYFNNSKIKPVDSCNEVVSVTRTIPKTEKIATAALNEMLKGPTPEEKVQGYGSAIPAGSKLNSLAIVNGEARADFNDITESGGGSCSMRMRATQIQETLLQFPTVKTVKISINGRTDYIFQP